MKRYLLYLAALLVLVLALFTANHRAFAAGSTSSDTNPGQVKVSNQDGTVYLTTEINTNNSAAPKEIVASQQNMGTAPNNITGIINRPIGFADNLGEYLSSLLNIIMVISLLLVFLYFILAGFQWITSGGDKGKTEEARNKIVNAFVGILIVASSFAVATFVAYILGFDSINDALGSVRQIDTP